MRVKILAFVLALLAAGVQGRQSQAKSSPAAEPPLEIYQIDLVPSGSGFALTKPVLQGDVYVFQAWPDRATVRLPKARVKNMVARTKDVSSEVVYQIDLVPTGKMFARDNPTMKAGTYQFHSWRGGTLMSVRQSDVQKVTRVAGMDAFRIHMEQSGAKQIANLPMQGGGTVSVLPSGAPADTQGAQAPPAGPPTNWVYYGLPGVTEGWAPPSAVVERPGDVPRAPEPHP